jgi:hypothetical protein
MTSRESIEAEQMNYLRWHNTAILTRYLPTCHATKEDAQEEADEIISRKPQLKGEIRPAQTRCFLRPISGDCYKHFPKRFKTKFEGEAVLERHARKTDSYGGGQKGERPL